MPMIPFVQNGYYPSRNWIPLVNGNGLTAGGGEPEPPAPVPTYTTVTGVSPLLLQNAIALNMKSLTQYGLCTQASKPTPDAPVDIVCNNGTLRMVDDELPTGYKRVLGFECNNNAMWQITGFKLKGSDTVRISFSVNAACNVFGCYQGADANDNYDLYVSTSSNAKYFRYGSGTYLSAWSSNDLGERFDVVYTPNGSQGMPQDSTWSPLTFTSANDLLIGSTTFTGTSAKLKGNLYGDFIVDGRLKLVPCERVSDGVLGYYDTYSETFYEPYTGFDGAVSLGYDGSHYSLQTVGTPEVLTVSGKQIWNETWRVGTWGVSVDTAKKVFANDRIASNDFIDVKPNTTYTLSVDDETYNGGFYIVGAHTLEGDGAITVAQSNSGKSATFTTRATTNFIGFSLRPVYGTSYQSNVILELGSTATDYVPYVQPQTVTDIPMLLGVGDYKDEGEIISGIKTGKVGVKVFDGTEDWTAFTSSTLVIQNATSAWGAVAGVGGYCTHLTVLKAGETTFAGSCRFATAFNLYEYKTAFDVADVAGFKAKIAALYAAGTPVILVYPLATETTEQTTPHALHTTAGTNVVDVTANVSPVELAVEYAKEAS